MKRKLLCDDRAKTKQKNIRIAFRLPDKPRHGHSYLSTDSGNIVSAKMFSDPDIATKMCCGRTKSETLVENVFHFVSKD